MDVSAPPRLLLDANVFRDLASGELGQFEARLLRVAACRLPPLLWICPITFDEIVSHVRAKEMHRFQHFRDSLRWVDRLCCNTGIAEDLQWILQRGVFAGSGAPYDNRTLSVSLNQVRRALIKVERFEDVPQQIVELVAKVRADSVEKIDSWVERRRELHAKVRIKPGPGEPRLEVAYQRFIHTQDVVIVGEKGDQKTPAESWHEEEEKYFEAKATEGKWTEKWAEYVAGFAPGEFEKRHP